MLFVAVGILVDKKQYKSMVHYYDELESLAIKLDDRAMLDDVKSLKKVLDELKGSKNG